MVKECIFGHRRGQGEDTLSERRRQLVRAKIFLDDVKVLYLANGSVLDRLFSDLLVASVLERLIALLVDHFNLTGNLHDVSDVPLIGILHLTRREGEQRQRPLLDQLLPVNAVPNVHKEELERVRLLTLLLNEGLSVEELD